MIRYLIFALLFPLCAAAQTNTVPAQFDLPAEELRLRLRPLDQDELKATSAEWLTAVKGLASTVSELEIRQLKGDDAEGATQLDQAREARSDAVARFRLVLDEFKAKGGDPAKHEQYIKAISGMQMVEATDVGGVWDALESWARSKEGGMKWVVNFIQFIVVLLAAHLLGNGVGCIAGKAMEKTRLSGLLETFIVNASRRIILLLGFLVALSMLEINIGPMLAGVGVVGFIIGFALQDTLSNFASGFMILIYKPYDVGDGVSAAGVTGAVEAMNLVSTTFRTWDNQKVVVPNSKIWGDIITNITGNKTRRIDLVFGIGYEDDPGKAMKLLGEIMSAHDKVLAEPEPVIRVDALADSSVNLVCRPWVNTTDYASTRWDLIEAVKSRFDAAGISFPYPQRDVHMKPGS